MCMVFPLPHQLCDWQNEELLRGSMFTAHMVPGMVLQPAGARARAAPPRRRGCTCSSCSKLAICSSSLAVAVVPAVARAMPLPLALATSGSVDAHTMAVTAPASVTRNIARHVEPGLQCQGSQGATLVRQVGQQRSVATARSAVDTVVDLSIYPAYEPPYDHTIDMHHVMNVLCIEKTHL